MKGLKENFEEEKKEIIDEWHDRVRYFASVSIPRKHLCGRLLLCHHRHFSVVYFSFFHSFIKWLSSKEYIFSAGDQRILLIVWDWVWLFKKESLLCKVSFPLQPMAMGKNFAEFFLLAFSGDVVSLWSIRFANSFFCHEGLIWTKLCKASSSKFTLKVKYLIIKWYCKLVLFPSSKHHYDSM